MVVTLVALVVLISTQTTKNGVKNRRSDTDGGSDEKMKQFLETEFEKEITKWLNKKAVADWNYQADIDNKKKEEINIKTAIKYREFKKKYWNKHFKDLNVNKIKDEDVKRTVEIAKNKLFFEQGLDDEKIEKLSETLFSLKSIYISARVCPYETKDCDLDKDGLSLYTNISQIFKKTRDFGKLSYYWKAWRDATGAKMRGFYKNAVTLTDEGVLARGLKHLTDVWLRDYQTPTFQNDLDRLWKQVEPLYIQLHKYVGKKLKESYGDEIDVSDGLIPANILGDIWGENWQYLSDLARPHPNVNDIIDIVWKDRDMTILSLYKTADEFYKSMGLMPNDICYNTTAGSIIEKPDKKRISCVPAAVDFHDGKNYRIRMCTRSNFDFFLRIHKLMGHIQYFLQFAKQPVMYRDGANPSFLEAVGDMAILSVSTPKHFKNIGFIENYDHDEKTLINYLMDLALNRIPQLPFTYIVDKWRWDVFSGSVKEDKWNSHWWDYRKKYQKLKPPMERSDKTDFDPGSKYQIPAGIPYISYFLDNILQFQLFKGMCLEAGEYDPNNDAKRLYECDIYNSKAAGKKLKAALSLGTSKHWVDILEMLTGERKLNGSPLLEYFKPLHEYLKKENSK